MSYALAMAFIWQQDWVDVLVILLPFPVFFAHATLVGWL